MRNLGKIALCLPGGGAKGIVQAAMYQAFKDLELKYDILIGTSAGAINACMIHQGDSNKLLDLWENIKSSCVYTSNLFKFFNLGVLNNQPLSKLIKKYIDYSKLLPREEPLYINVTDMDLKSKLTLSIGDFEDAEEFYTFLRSSASPPLYFEPLLFRGSRVCDGGLISNFNIDIARKEKCDKIIILSPSRGRNIEPDSWEGVVDVVLSASSESNLEQNLGEDVLFIKPMMDIDVGLLDFDYRRTRYSRNQLMQIGYYSAYNILKKELCL